MTTQGCGGMRQVACGGGRRRTSVQVMRRELAMLTAERNGVLLGRHIPRVGVLSAARQSVSADQQHDRWTVT